MLYSSTSSLAPEPIAMYEDGELARHLTLGSEPRLPAAVGMNAVYDVLTLHNGEPGGV